ncbi:hypothetical protein JG688_00014141 [Phytophthora aleatoria]|uniref:Fibronectin type-III domain-containing protein n=1 Tax=Phytophthora aleatoria TaxID=2496075 RepID=A0A8J5I7U9_9STRA|nr:hypothetical protein JG688_00014141 [Phytophthora aleatoria]
MQAALQVTTSSYSIKVTKTVRNAALNSAIWSVTFAYLRGEEMVGAGNIFTMTVASSQLTGTNAVVRVANKVTGSDPSRFTVTDLRPGVKYFAHVMAYNADGFGSANSPLASAVTCSQPPAPQSVTASVVDGTTLQVDWSASTASELCSVDKYKVEWYRAEGTQEQQTITTSAGKGIPEIQRLVNIADSQTLSGYFKLSFGGEMTENIRWDAAAIGLNSVKERNGGASITSYQVQWDTSVDFTNPMKVDVLVSSTDTAPFYYNIPVTSVMKYYVRVFAVNNQGDGAFAVPSPSSITPMDRTPGRPEDATAKVLSSYAILVEWKPSSTEKIYYGGDGGLPTTQYMVEWDNSPGFDSPPAFGLVDGTKRSYIIGGDDAITGVRSDKLVAGSSYSIRVTVFNAKGAGAPRSTTPASVTVTDQPPSSPQNLKLSVVTSTSVKAEWMNPLYDGGESLKSYQIEWDEQDDFSSGQSSSATISIIREMQSIELQNDVVNEEQFVDATVKVTNEEQVVRTTFTGLDEVQLITTTNSVVVDEVQTVVTSATDRNEVQELRLDGDDVDEIQAIRTSVTEVLQVQTLKVVVARTSEVQTITLTLPGAFATPATSIGGTIYFSFDSSICTHCVKKMYQRTINLVSSLQDNTVASAALTVKNALNDLANIDTVDVTRTQNPTGPDLTYVYTIVFSGMEVAGNVPTIGIDAAVTVGGNAVSGIPTQAAQITAGSEYCVYSKRFGSYLCWMCDIIPWRDLHGGSRFENEYRVFGKDFGFVQNPADFERYPVKDDSDDDF